MTIPAFVAERALFAAKGQYLPQPQGPISGAVTQAGPQCMMRCMRICGAQGYGEETCGNICSPVCAPYPVTAE